MPSHAVSTGSYVLKHTLSTKHTANGGHFHCRLKTPVINADIKTSASFSFDKSGSMDGNIFAWSLYPSLLSNTYLLASHLREESFAQLIFPFLHTQLSLIQPGLAKQPVTKRHKSGGITQCSRGTYISY